MMSYLPELPDVLIPRLKQALAATDKAALYNVTHDNKGQSILDAGGNPIKGKFSRGGPFGAMLGISIEDGSFEVIGQPYCNNVVGSGIASFHAEDQALQYSNYQTLTTRLFDLRIRGHNPYVWMISSGQSCTNCHTKQEIAARDLEAENLLTPGHFMALYGATYDDTFKIAQFYDAQYADAMILSSFAPDCPQNLIRQERIAYQDAPFEIKKIFAHTNCATAIVMRDDEIYAHGKEARTDFDRYATAEVNAIRAACRRNRKEGEFASWMVDGELYTTNTEIGPLLFAEAGWTKINTIKCVEMPPQLVRHQYKTRETMDIGNTALLKIIAGGYRHPLASVRVLRDENFQNTAQPKWAEVLAVNNEQLYNGAAVSPEVERMRNIYTRYRFAAHDICNCAVSEAYRPLQILDPHTPSKDIA